MGVGDHELARGVAVDLEGHISQNAAVAAVGASVAIQVGLDGWIALDNHLQ